VKEHVVSEHALSLAGRRALSNLLWRGALREESLLFCEFYIRERMPVAMQEIEQNAVRPL
jgi:hypothetical protein